MLDRKYGLRALVPATGLIVEWRNVRAGSSGVVIRLPDDAYRPTIRGRVVDLQGEPVGGLNVRVEVPAYSIPSREGTEPGYGMMHAGSSATTDEDGRFELNEVPSGPTTLFASGSGYDRTPYELDAHDLPGPDEIEIKIPRRVSLRVEVADYRKTGAMAFSLMDGNEEVVDLSRRVGTAYTRSGWSDLTEGKSELVSSSELATTLVLWNGDEIVGRTPVLLVPGEVNVIRP